METSDTSLTQILSEHRKAGATFLLSQQYLQQTKNMEGALQNAMTLYGRLGTNDALVAAQRFYKKESVENSSLVQELFGDSKQDSSVFSTAGNHQENIQVARELFETLAPGQLFARIGNTPHIVQIPYLSPPAVSEEQIKEIEEQYAQLLYEPIVDHTQRERVPAIPDPLQQEEQGTFEKHAVRRTQTCPINSSSPFHLPDTTETSDLLMLLYLFGWLDINQLARLVHVQEQNINNLRAKVKRELVTPGLVEEQDKPRKTASRGKPPRCYSLTNKGRDTLGKLRGFSPIKAKAELGHHFLQCTDLLVSAALLPTVAPLTLLHMESEHFLKQRPLPIGDSKAVVPDGFISYALGGEPYGIAHEIVGIAFEWDEGSESTYHLRDKFTNWVTAATGAYQERFGINSLTIAFCCSDDRRMVQMLRLAEEVLVKQRSYAELFVFGACDPATIDPLTLMTSPIFRQPFDNSSHALIETCAVDKEVVN
jgi:hypothetical protein